MTCGPFSSPLPLPALPYTDRQPIHRRLKNTFTGSKLYSSFTSRKLVARSSSTKQEARAEAATLEPLRASNTGKDGALPPVLSTWRTALGDTVGSFREEPALLAITLVYLVQGLTDLAWLAEKYYLKDELHASPAQVAYFLSLASIPWMVKPLIGFVSDSFPLFGYRRRSYLLLASGAAAGSWLYMAVSPGAMSTSLAAILVGSAAGAVSDVVVDSMVVERARDEDQAAAGSLQSLCWAAYAVGQIVTAALSGSMVEMRGPRFVFGVTAAFPLLIGLASLIVHEERVEGPQQGSGAGAMASSTTTTTATTSVLPADAAAPSSSTPLSQQLARQQPLAQQQQHHKQQAPSLASVLGTCTRAAAAALSSRVAALYASAAAARSAAAASRSAAWDAAAAQGGALWGALSTPAIAWPVAFLMLLSATPAADDAVFYFEVEALSFTPSFLGSVQLAIAVASLMGVWVYNAYFKSVPLRSFLLWGNLLGAVLQCSDLLLVTRLNTRLFGGLDDHLFVLGGSVVTSVIANVLAMPTLVLAARLCPKGLEATMFATIMSLLNMADGVRYAGGAALMEALGVGSGSYANLPLLVGLCNAALLLPLPVLALVPGNLDCDSLVQAGGPAAGEAGAQGPAAGGQKVAEAAASGARRAEVEGIGILDLGLGAGASGEDPWVGGAGGYVPVPVVMAARAEQAGVGAAGPLPAPAQPLDGPLVGPGGQGHQRERIAWQQQQQQALPAGPRPPPALLPACSSAGGAAPQPSAAVAAAAASSAAAMRRGSRTAGATAVPAPGPLGDDDRVDEGADGGAGEPLAAVGVPPAAPSGSRHSAAAAALLGGLQAFPSELRRGAVRGPRRVLPGSELDWAGGGAGAGGQRPGAAEGGWGLSE